jgi:hypothetical protein
MSLENLPKKDLADKVRNLTEIVKELKAENELLKAQNSANVAELQDGESAIGVARQEDGTFLLVKLVYDLQKNAAAIVTKEDISKDMQIAGGTMMKKIGEVFYKAAGIK